MMNDHIPINKRRIKYYRNNNVRLTIETQSLAVARFKNQKGF